MEKISSFIDYNMWDDTRSAALRLYIGGFGQLQSMWDVTCDHFFFLPIVGLRSTRSPLNFALSSRYLLGEWTNPLNFYAELSKFRLHQFFIIIILKS